MSLARTMTDTKLDHTASTIPTKSPPPRRPSKPTALQGPSGDSMSFALNQSAPFPTSARKPIPPPKPRKLSASQEPNQPSGPSPLSQTQIASQSRSITSSPERQGYRASVRNKVANAYNSLPAWSSYNERQSQGLPPRSTPADDINRTQKLPPPIPPRRGLSSYPAAAAHYATNRLSGGWSGNSAEDTIEDANGNTVPRSVPQLSKKEEIWNHRWDYAKKKLEEKGVMLRSWRKGEDAMEEAMKLIEKVECGL